MSRRKILDPKTYGEKMYERFPHTYHNYDAENKYTLKRYFQAIGDGIEPFIEDLNKFLDFYDPTKVDIKILPHVFSSFGLEMFNGIPEFYMRNLLPMIGQLYKRKGTKEVIEYITSIIADAKVEVEFRMIKKNSAILGQGSLGNFVLGDNTAERPAIMIHIELDYGTVGTDYPDEEQIKRIVKEFVPFFCLVVAVYTYLYIDKTKLDVRDNKWGDYIIDAKEDSTFSLDLMVSDAWDEALITQDYQDTVTFANIRKKESSILGEGILGQMLFGDSARATLGSGVFGGALFGLSGDDISQSYKYDNMQIHKSNHMIEDLEDLYAWLTKERANFDIREKLDDYAINIFEATSGVLGNGILGWQVFGRALKPERDVFLFTKDHKSDIIRSDAKVRVSFENYGYLPPKSAVLGNGQPMGKMVFGTNRPYTTVDYTEDVIRDRDGNIIKTVVIG